MKKTTSKHRFPKALPEGPELHKLIFGMSSEAYHGTAGTYSSSQFKDLLEDEEIFINKYVHKTVEREHIPAFDVGNYFHTGVLEPEKLAKECAVYQKRVRRGKDWDKFKAKHPGKVIVSLAQVEQATRLIDVVQDSPVAMSYIQRGKPEVSLFIQIAVLHGEIYAPNYGVKLGRSGWVVEDNMPTKAEMKDAVILTVKVRADSLGEDFVLDLKSTTGNARSDSAMREKIKYYNYDLSAALYLDLFSLPAKKQMDTFIWTFASKDCHNCKSYSASERNIQIGRVKWSKAVLMLAECQKNQWALYDSLGILEPHHSELYHLVEKDTDFL